MEALLAALVGQRFQKVLAVRRGIDDVVGGGLGVEQAETVVVLRRDDDVLHAGGLGDAHPLGRVVLHGVELLGQGLVFGDGDVGGVHDPFAAAGWDGLALPLAGGMAYSPQWMNMPKRASRHQAMRASRCCCLGVLGSTAIVGRALVKERRQAKPIQLNDDVWRDM